MWCVNNGRLCVQVWILDRWIYIPVFWRRVAYAR